MKMRKIAKSAKCCSVHVKRPESLQNFSQIILLAQFLAHVKVQQLAVRKCSQNSSKIPGSSKTGSKLGLPKPTLPDEKRGKVGHDCNPILVDREFHLRLPRLYFPPARKLIFGQKPFAAVSVELIAELAPFCSSESLSRGDYWTKADIPATTPRPEKSRGAKRNLFFLFKIYLSFTSRRFART